MTIFCILFFCILVYQASQTKLVSEYPNAVDYLILINCGSEIFHLSFIHAFKNLNIYLKTRVLVSSLYSPAFGGCMKDFAIDDVPVNFFHGEVVNVYLDGCPSVPGASCASPATTEEYSGPARIRYDHNLQVFTGMSLS